jgi:hypothetical protein
MFSREDLLTILACLECKEYNTQGKIDSRVPVEDGKNVIDIVDMLNRIEKIKTVIRDQL